MKKGEYEIKDWQRLCEPKNHHPAANMFTLLDDKDLAVLAEGIKTTGLLYPIVMLDDKVLDGRNRLAACRLAGVTPRFVEWDGSGQSPTEWVAATNSQRRDLTQSQRAVAALYVIKNAQPSEEVKQQFRDGSSRKWDHRIWVGNIVGVGRHYISDIEQIERWATMDSKCTQWDELPSDPQPWCLEDIKTGNHSVASMKREIDFKVAQIKNPELTQAENAECPTGDLAKNFFALVPRHSMRLAYDSALKSLAQDEQKRLARYWERLEKEYAWYEAS
jgi:hypothetical protein